MFLPPYFTGNSFEIQSGLLVKKYYIVCVVIASRVGIDTRSGEGGISELADIASW
jgi:hypothetical protein